MTSRDAGDTAWVLDPVLEVPHVVAAVLLTRDGLVTGWTDALSRPSATWSCTEAGSCSRRRVLATWLRLLPTAPAALSWV